MPNETPEVPTPAAPTPTAAPAPCKTPEPRALFYVISFFVSLFGIIFGIVYLTKPDPECKRFGKNCLLWGIIPPIIYIIIWVIVVFLIIGTATITAPALEGWETALFLS